MAGEKPGAVTIASTNEDWYAIGQQFITGGLGAIVASNSGTALTAKTTDILGHILATAFQGLAPIGIGMARGITLAEDAVAPAFADMAATAASDIFGVTIPRSAFQGASGGGARTEGGAALGRGFMDLMRGQGAQLVPSDAPAARYVTAIAGMALEDWFKGWFFEIMTSLVPQLDVGKIESYAALSDKVSNVLGLTGVSRRVFRPIVDATIVTPLEWQTNKTYRPRLLAPAQCVKQIVRHPGARELWLEEMRRQGYREDQIEALVTEGKRFFGPSDVRTFVYRQHWTHSEGLQHLRDQGYDEAAAGDALRLEGLKRIAAIEADEATAIAAAYVARDIDHGEFSSALSAAVTVPAERALLIELAEVRRAMNIKRLTIAQVEPMVKSGVLDMRAYIQAAERAGYPDGDVDALELQLRWEISKAKSVAELRAAQAAARAAAKLARDEAAAVRRAALEARRALARRGNEADLERAAIRGLIPLARVGEVYAATFDAETAAILLELLEDERQTYLNRQDDRAAAAKRAAARGIDVGALERAVWQNVITLAEYRAQLADRGFSDGDVAILAETLEARVADRDAATRARDEAAKDAAVRRVSLSTIETLVRRGHRSIAEYDALLAELGYDEGARAAMRELLQDRIDEDAAARAERERAAARGDARGLTLEQMRRAVLLGQATIDELQTYLVAEQYTPDAQRLLLAAIRADVVEAEAARERRAEAERARTNRDAPVGDVARAARLGLVPVAVYVDRLARAGFSADAIALEVDLLVEEMAAAADARARREAAEAADQGRPLSLADAARSVRAGLIPLDSYIAAARTAGYSLEAAATLGRLLEDELAAAAAARARREQIATAGRVREVSLAQLEAAVALGLWSVEQYAAAVRGLGYQDDDVALLVALLAEQLARVEDAEARQRAIAEAQPIAAAALSAVAAAVLEGLIGIEGYVAELRARGFGAGAGLAVDPGGRLVLADGVAAPLDDTALLALLLQARVDAAAAGGAA